MQRIVTTRYSFVGLVCSDEQPSIWPARSDSDNGRNQNSGLFFPQQLQFAWLCCSCRYWRHQTCLPFHTRKKRCYLLTGSNYITWAPSVPCCLLSRHLLSRWGYFAHPSVRNQRPSDISFAESKCVPTTLAFFNGVSVAWSLCALLHLFHMKPRGSLAATVLTVKHCLRAAPTVKVYIRQTEEAFCLPSG